MIRPHFYFKATAGPQGIECVVTYIRAGKFYKVSAQNVMGPVNKAGLPRDLVIKPIDKFSESILCRGLLQEDNHIFYIQHPHVQDLGSELEPVVKQYFEDRHGSLQYAEGSTGCRVCDIVMAVTDKVWLGVELVGKEAIITYSVEEGQKIAKVAVTKPNGDVQTVNVPYT